VITQVIGLHLFFFPSGQATGYRLLPLSFLFLWITSDCIYCLLVDSVKAAAGQSGTTRSPQWNNSRCRFALNFLPPVFPMAGLLFSLSGRRRATYRGG
jgi:hypothetical protein